MEDNTKGAGALQQLLLSKDYFVIFLPVSSPLLLRGAADRLSAPFSSTSFVPAYFLASRFMAAWCPPGCRAAGGLVGYRYRFTAASLMSTSFPSIFSLAGPRLVSHEGRLQYHTLTPHMDGAVPVRWCCVDGGC